MRFLGIIFLIEDILAWNVLIINFVIEERAIRVLRVGLPRSGFSPANSFANQKIIAQLDLASDISEVPMNSPQGHSQDIKSAGLSKDIQYLKGVGRFHKVQPSTGCFKAIQRNWVQNK